MLQQVLLTFTQITFVQILLLLLKQNISVLLLLLFQY